MANVDGVAVCILVSKRDNTRAHLNKKHVVFFLFVSLTLRQSPVRHIYIFFFFLSEYVEMCAHRRHNAYVCEHVWLRFETPSEQLKCSLYKKKSKNEKKENKRNGKTAESSTK